MSTSDSPPRPSPNLTSDQPPVGTRPAQKTSADPDAPKSAFSNPAAGLTLTALSAAAAGSPAATIPPAPGGSYDAKASPSTPQRAASAGSKPVPATITSAPWGWPQGAAMPPMGPYPMLPQQMGLMGYPGMPYGMPGYPPMPFSVPTMYSDPSSASASASSSQDPATHPQMANMAMPFYPFAMNQMQQMMAMSQLSGVSPMGTPMMPMLPSAQFVQPLPAAVAAAVGKPVSLKDSARLKALVDELSSPQMPACVNCRRSKVRCEGGIPCTRCKRLAWEDTCSRCVPQKRGRKRKTALSPGSQDGDVSPSKASASASGGPSPSSSFVLSSTSAAATASRSRLVSPQSAKSDTNSFSSLTSRASMLPSAISIPPPALGRGNGVKQELNISAPSSSFPNGVDASTITSEMLRQMFQAAIDAAIPLLIEPSATPTDSVSAQTLAEKVAALVLLEKYPAEHVLPRAIKHMDTLHQTGALDGLIPTAESPSKKAKRTAPSEPAHRFSAILPHLTQLIVTSPFWPATTDGDSVTFKGFKLRPDALQIQVPASAYLPPVAAAPPATTISSVLLGSSANSPSGTPVEAPHNLEQKFKEIASIEEELKKRREELESLYRERHAALIATISNTQVRTHSAQSPAIVTQSPAIVAQSPSGASVASESAGSDITASTSNETAAISVLAAAACSSVSTSVSGTSSSL